MGIVWDSKKLSLTCQVTVINAEASKADHSPSLVSGLTPSHES